ncbi:restriction endonuclease subunit S [Marinobacter fuscus]|uniref:Restriction endonuclease subunit S n=1 Tax=Marinobacter fuscus TaxID=2109942 RepID=A0A2T1KDK7_9GAMM|nr:restriction endonuclease subunit S [Marinobacter fuscus]PSF08206.1 restriction endonuclease subunit S [Marinobacter fuscus]
MPANWLEYSLVDLCSEITVGHVGSMTNEYRDSGIPFFRSKNIREYRIDWDDVKYISESFHERLKKSMLRPGDVAVVRTGKPGTACVIPDYIDEANCSDLVIMRVNPQRLSAYFLSYYLNSVANHQINSQLVGAVQQHFNVGAAKKLSITIPDRNEQERIVKVVKDLDDKIQLNHKINQTLEQMAQAIFKSWFVDFEPVKAKIAALEAGGSEEDALLAAMQAISGKGEAELTRLQAEQPEQYAELRATAELFPWAMQDSELGEIPEGWEVQSVGDICRSTDYVANGSFKALKENVRLYDEKNEVIYVRTTDFNKGFASDLKYTDMASYEFLSKSKLFGRETIISNVGDVGTVFRAPTWLRQNMTLGSNAVALISGDYDGYLFWLFRSDHGQNLIQSIVTGSAQLKFNKTNLRALRVIMPSKSVLDLFERKERIFHEKYNAIKRENLSLEHLRDYLLPKLLSGEASVIAVDHHPADEAETADV